MSASDRLSLGLPVKSKRKSPKQRREQPEAVEAVAAIREGGTEGRTNWRPAT